MFQKMQCIKKIKVKINDMILYSVFRHGWLSTTNKVIAQMVILLDTFMKTTASPGHYVSH